MTDTRTNQEPATSSNAGLYAGIAAVALATVGLVLSLQNVSLITGAGIVWTGFALATVAALIAWMVPSVRRWIQVITIIAALIGLTAGIYDEHQLSNQRHEIQQILQYTP